MEYTEQEEKEVRKFWEDTYVSSCEICHGKGVDDDKVCKCTLKAAASANLELNGFGRKYLLLKLKTSKLLNDITAYFTDFKNHYRAGKGLFIFGQHSTGKTLAVTYLARNILERMNPMSNDFSIKFFLYDDFVRFSYDEKSFTKLERMIKKTNILVIDNVGNETGLRTQARSSVALLENIVRNREMNGKPTWITTALSTEEMRKLYSDQICTIIKRNSKIICSNT